MAKPLVWSEVEAGDWEACVAASYLTGMVYAGWTAFPLGIYTQAEREAIEAVADSPQDYATTDAEALARYGVKLRPLSTGSLESAVSRVGVGLVLAGYGGLLIATNAPIHSVFYLPTSSTAGLLYDPLAANKSAGVSLPASRILGWAKGPGANDAREVREDELGEEPMSESTAVLTLYPDGVREWTAKGGNLTGYALNGATKVVNVNAGSMAHADGTATITQSPKIAPNGSGFIHVTDGALAGLYLVRDSVNGPFPNEEPVPPTDCAAEVAAERARWTAWLSERPDLGLEAWLTAAPEAEA